MDIYGLKNFKRMNVAVTVICGIAVAVLTCLASFMFVKTYQAVTAQERSVYNYIGNGYIGNDVYYKNANTYFFLYNINVKESADSSILKTDVFMQDKGMSYYGNYLDGFSENGEIYAADECAVSADFAKRLNLKEGDEFVIHIQGVSDDYIVTVKKILPEYLGYDKTDIFNPKGAVVLGNIPEAVKNNLYYKILAFAEDSKATYAGTGAPVHKSDILGALYKNYYIASAVSAIAVIIAVTLLDGFFGGKERSDAAIFYSETGNKSRKLVYITVYSLYKHLASFAVSFLLSLIAIAFGYRVGLFALVFNVVLFAVRTALSVLINYFTAKSR